MRILVWVDQWMIIMIMIILVTLSCKWITILIRKLDLELINKQKRSIIWWILLSQKTIKIKKIDKYLDLTREQKRLCSMKMMGILIVFGALGTASKGLEKRLKEIENRGRFETIWITALLKSARIHKSVLETRGDLLSHRL